MKVLTKWKKIKVNAIGLKIFKDRVIKLLIFEVEAMWSSTIDTYLNYL